MNWLETIELRTSLNQSKTVEKTIDLLIKELNQNNKELRIYNFSHLTINTDFSIHIVHNCKEINKVGSVTALSIISCLKTYGSINHNIWVKAESKNLGKRNNKYFAGDI